MLICQEMSETVYACLRVWILLPKPPLTHRRRLPVHGFCLLVASRVVQRYSHLIHAHKFVTMLLPQALV